MSIHLHGMGHFHPENEISNRFLEELDIGTTNDWIVDRVGIHSRRTVLPLDYVRATRNADVRAAREAAVYAPQELAARAADMALERAGVSRDQIGIVISGSNAPGSVCPAEACYVARELGIRVPAYDLNSACSTFVAQMVHLSMMDPAKLPEFVLLTQIECLTTVTDYADRATAVLFGDGAAAAVVSLRTPGRARILHAHSETDPSGADKISINRTTHFTQDGRAVQMFAIKKTREGVEKLREAVSEEGGPARPLHFVGHQANLRVLDQVCQRCDVPAERHHYNVDHRGNTGGASAPAVLSEAWDKLAPGDDVAVSVVGGGLTWARALVRFDEEPAS